MLLKVLRRDPTRSPWDPADSGGFFVCSVMPGRPVQPQRADESEHEEHGRDEQCPARSVGEARRQRIHGGPRVLPERAELPLRAQLRDRGAGRVPRGRGERVDRRAGEAGVVQGRGQRGGQGDEEGGPGDRGAQRRASPRRPGPGAGRAPPRRPPPDPARSARCPGRRTGPPGDGPRRPRGTRPRPSPPGRGPPPSRPGRAAHLLAVSLPSDEQREGKHRDRERDGNDDAGPQPIDGLLVRCRA